MYLLLFIPGTPKDILTYLAGLTPMRLPSWLVILSARLISVVTSTVSGGLLGTQNYVFGIVVFTVTAVVAGIGIMYYKRLNQKAEEDQRRSETDEINERFQG